VRAVVVPGVLALLPEYAAQTDPVPELRAACHDAVAWLGPEPVVIADAPGERVARALLSVVSGATSSRPGAGTPRTSTTGGAYLVVANGTARRTQTSPGPYDERAEPFDDLLAKALVGPEPEALRRTDLDLAGRLWASTAALPRLADLLTGTETVTVDYDDAPYGVRYWVVRYAG